MSQNCGEKLVCTFCYKAFEIKRGDEEGNEIFQRFCKILRRLLVNSRGQITGSLKPNSYSRKHNINLSSIGEKIKTGCDVCNCIIANFCQFYFAMQSLQLKLDYQLDKLYEIMKCADKVPTRLKKFKDSYAGDEQSGGIRKFRQDVYTTCGTLLETRIPRVLLKPVDTSYSGQAHPIDSFKMTNNLDPSSFFEESNKDLCQVDDETNSINSDGHISTSSEIFPDDMQIEICNGILIKSESNEPYKAETCKSPLVQNAPVTNVCKFVELGDHPSSTNEILQTAENSKEFTNTMKVIDDSSDDEMELSKTDSAELDANDDISEKDQPLLAAQKEAESMDAIPENTSACPSPLKVEPEIADDESSSTPCSSRTSSPATRKGSMKRKRKRSAKPVKVPQNKRAILATVKCSIATCNETFRTDEEMEIHVRLHGIFSCDFCKFVTNRADTLFEHELKSHSTQTKVGDLDKVKCPRCPRLLSAAKIGSRQFHFLSFNHFLSKHLGIGLYAGKTCPICQHAFRPPRIDCSIKVHMRKSHDITGKTPEEIFNCEDCKAYFVTDRQLLHHRRKIHGFKRFPCNLCHKSFSRSRCLSEHRERLHKEFNTYVCKFPRCGKSFPSEYSYSDHKKIHRGTTKMLECSVCSKLFANDNLLQGHIKSHNQSKSPPSKRNTVHSVTCEKCGKTFSSSVARSVAKNRLQIHKQTHDHDGPSSWEFSCDICGKMCQTVYKLEEHMRTHSKDKPFVCEHCGRKFSIKYNLKRHLKLVHKIKVPNERKSNRVSEQVPQMPNDEDSS